MAAALVNVGCAGTGSGLGPWQPQPLHLVSQLRFETSPIDLTAFFWIDNEQVMFAAHPLGSDTNVQTHKDGIYVWNVKTNITRKYADLSAPHTWEFSYDNGNILYTQEPIRIRPLPSAYMLGKMGQESRHELTWAEHDASPLVSAALGAHGDATYQPGDGTTSLVYHLRPGDGMLMVHTVSGRDAVFDGGEEPVRLLRTNGSAPIVLPIVGRELGGRTTIWYSEYLGVYVILPGLHRTRVVRGTSGFQDGDAHPVYLLSPNGDVQTQEIPAGPWSPMAAFVTRAGLMWISRDFNRDWKEAGAWILADGKPRKLFDFGPEGVSVSPDGCTVSFAVGNNGSREPFLAQAVRVCAHEPR